MNMNSIPRGGEYLLKLTLLKNKQMNRQWVWMRQAANGKGVKCKGRQIMKAILVMIHDSSEVVKVVDIRYRHERIGMSTCSFVTQSNLKLECSSFTQPLMPILSLKCLVFHSPPQP